MPISTAKSTPPTNSQIDSGYLTHATTWFGGDFNYDGIVNGSDYTLIDNAFNTQSAVVTATLANPTVEIAAEITAPTAVPEPSAAALAAVASMTLLRRRKTSSPQL